MRFCFFGTKCTKIIFFCLQPRLIPGPCWESYDTPPNLIVDWAGGYPFHISLSLNSPGCPVRFFKNMITWQPKWWCLLWYMMWLFGCLEYRNNVTWQQGKHLAMISVFNSCNLLDKYTNLHKNAELGWKRSCWWCLDEALPPPPADLLSSTATAANDLSHRHSTSVSFQSSYCWFISQTTHTHV